jgi:hypothetical protein
MHWAIVHLPRWSCGTPVAGRPLWRLSRVAPATYNAPAPGFDTLRLSEHQNGLGPRDHHLAVDELNTDHTVPPFVWGA